MNEAENNRDYMYIGKSITSHWSIGNFTLYGRNAMSWAFNIHTKRWGWIHFNIPFLSRWPFHFYVSPNATPWACTYYWGKDKSEKIRSMVRKSMFGHNFNTDTHEEKLSAINSKFADMYISQYDVDLFGMKPETDD